MKNWEFTYPRRVGDTAFGKNLKYVLEEHDRTFAEQVDDFKALSKGPGKLLFPDYYRYGLYRYMKMKVPEQALEFVGKRQQLALMNAECDVKAWGKDVLNKDYVAERLEEGGFKQASTMFTYNDSETRMSVREWLLDESNYPFFGKPVVGRQSGGVCHATGIRSGNLQMACGGEIEMERFIKGIHRHRRSWVRRKNAGYQFQQVLKNSSELVEVVGETLATFRVVAVKRNSGFKVKHCVWKMPLAGEIADNHWRGAALAGVDVDTGRIVNAMVGTGRTRETIRKHPETKKDLVGMVVPQMEELKEFVVSAARTFQDVGVQSWDIGITDDGPYVVEMNPGGDISIVQLAYDRGVLTPEYLLELRRKAEEKDDLKKHKRTFGEIERLEY